MEDMGGYGVVIGGSMGVITRCDHGVALRGVYGGYVVVLWGYRGVYGLQLHAVTTGWRCEVSMGVMGWFYGVTGGSMECNYTV